jgi:adenylate kinase family enzyme
VYGVTGSGKSTLAAQISAATGIPWHSVDDLTWEPDWVAVDDQEQRRRIAAICARPAWILDTAYGKWLDVPLARVEVIVALDYPRWLSLSRLITRTARRLVDRRTICNGNRETLRQTFGPTRSCAGISDRSHVSARGFAAGSVTHPAHSLFG